MTQRNLVRFLILLLHGTFWLPFLQARLLQGQAVSSEPLNLIVQIDGQVKVKRQGWTAYAPVVFGTALHGGDLLNLSESSRAKVVCSDLTLHDVPTGIGGVPCSVSRVVLRRVDGTLINATRGWPSDGSFPVVLSPRKTKLITANPTLRWSPVKEATAYRVTVRGEGGKDRLGWSKMVTSLTAIVYPETAPRFEVGIDYKLIVETNDGRSSEEPGLGLGFSMLSSNEKKIVLQEQKQIEKWGLPDGPTQFLVAHLYADHGLYAEAIERLEVISQTFKAAAVKRLLGDLYMDVGLARQAEAEYLNSLVLSKAENDDEGQMLLHKALAYIYEQIVGNKEAAALQFNATLDLAKKLGDDLTATQARMQLEQLKSPVAPLE
jgi:hypothetical protein